MSYLTHLECALTGETFPSEQLWNLAPSGKPLLARYDLKKVAAVWNRQDLAERPHTLWRYREVLPMRDFDNALSLGEGFTPLLPARRLGKALGFETLFIKDEGVNPTTSFKARGIGYKCKKAVEAG
ncbi:MAG TPA: pyridoxal-phosphate dependent enzyme, partial [Calditrichia bacterium]|nr:pyridoxal-phosphate dependent enzyme [Calditrichia bacterium]